MIPTKQKFDVAIIGGGPAGMFAAITGAKNGGRVVLIEKTNHLGKKLLLTGKGRCNLTNAAEDIKTFIEAFGKNGKFLFTSLNNFSNFDAVKFFEQLGLKTKVERGNRVFPVSDNSLSVLATLTSQLEKYHVTILKNTAVKNLIVKNHQIEKIDTTAGDFTAKKYIIATGGLSYPETGCTGDGFKWAKKLGHIVFTPQPALVPLLIKEDFIPELEGLSLKNVLISVYQNNKKQDERLGEALFTHQGLSGPIILDMSKHIGNLLKDKVELRIDFKPALNYPTLDQRIQNDFQEYKNKIFKNSLDKLLPQKLIPTIIRLSGIDENKKAAGVKREERKKLVARLKDFRLTVAGIEGFGRAIVTTGGIDLKEIDPKTMRSKIVDNLYFAGEVLNLDGPTGGYNLQMCWSTGYTAGSA